MEYVVSIRIPFPETIGNVLKREKDRFVSQYGSSYKSEPHITLYLDRYTREGFSKLINDLRGLSMKPFTISLLKPNVRLEEDRQNNLYVMDVSDKEQIQELHDKILELAIRYQSPLLRSKVRHRLEQQGIYTDGKRENLKDAYVDQTFDPHITLGQVGINDPQPDLKDVERNLKELVGEKITVSHLIVMFDGKMNDDKHFKLVEKATISLSKES